MGQYDLVQSVIHSANAPGNAAHEFVVCQHNHRGCGISKIFREDAMESVVVDEDGIKILIEECWRQGAFEIVVSEVKILELRNFQNHVREWSDKTIVAKVELVKKS